MEKMDKFECIKLIATFLKKISTMNKLNKQQQKNYFWHI
jgi:hypothetical protein